MADRKKSAAAKKAAQTKQEDDAAADAAANAQATESEQPQSESPPPESEQPQDSGSDEPDENGETQADRDAAGDARREKVMANRGNTGEGETSDLAAEQPRQPLENTDFDHQGAEDQRQAELARERERHDRLVGDASRGVSGLNAPA